jgi:hypothetical protein
MLRTAKAASAFYSSLLARLTFGLASIVLTGPVAAKPLAAWTELVGPNGEASVRAIVSHESPCPVLQSGNDSLQMRVRAEPGPSTLAKKGAELPVRVCEVQAPEGKTSVSLDGEAIPLPNAEIRRIIILGDTGCRIKKDKAQNCDDPNKPNKWLYPDLANGAAATHPDLVIHVGDYLYREKSCQGRAVVCPDTPVGYGWDVWEADFFAPSAKLLAAAPWIMVRGNHETCERAGEGWFRFLDHGPLPKRCPDLDMGGFFVTDIGGLGFVVMDSAAIAKDKDDDDDEDAPPELASTDTSATLRRQFAQISGSVQSPSWLLTHAPFNAVRLNKNTQEDQVDTTIEQRALGDLLPPAVKLMVSGHVHAFEAFSFGEASPARVPQLVVGNSGTKLAKEPEEPTEVGGVPVTSGLILSKFGYMVWDRDGANWNGQLFDETGLSIARCKLVERDLSCS